MEKMERDFKGVWIPKEVWLDERLNALDKMIVAEIDSLDHSETGCFASNQYIADFCQCSLTKVSTSISKLIECGYIYTKGFDGRTRVLKSRLSNFERQTFKNCETDFQKMKESNIEENIKENNKKERKKDTFDSIVSGFTTDQELQDAIFEYIKMRKLIKNPMTDRALRLLLQKLKELSTDRKTQIAILNQSIIHNWKSVYPLKDKNEMTDESMLEELKAIFGEDA